jgi:hypothetical protein
MLILAAALDAAIRHGFVRCAWHWMALGAVTLVAYGLVGARLRYATFPRNPSL